MYAVIMAGGTGTRFWPVSRENHPKQFLDMTSGAPMIVETCERIGSLARDEEMILVLGESQAASARELFGGRAVHIVPEPLKRNTAPCIGLGAVYADHLGNEGPVVFLPADHFIGDRGMFVESLRTAGECAASGGIATLGIIPSRPETGYGYIRRGRACDTAEGRQVYRVSAFVEKPDLERAKAYVGSGDYYWNAGIFVATPEVILREIEAHLPSLHQGLLRIRETLDTGDVETVMREVYGELESVSFDYGVMEKTRADVFVVPSDCGWSDVGSWSAIYELGREKRDPSRNLSEGETLLIDCEDSLIRGGGGRLVACVGLRHCLVVDTGDALLVADMRQSQRVGEIVAELKRRGRGDIA
jgi:mannose-1-phosphate guanylyltransferase